MGFRGKVYTELSRYISIRAHPWLETHRRLQGQARLALLPTGSSVPVMPRHLQPTPAPCPQHLQEDTVVCPSPCPSRARGSSYLVAL